MDLIIMGARDLEGVRALSIESVTRSVALSS